MQTSELNPLGGQIGDMALKDRIKIAMEGAGLSPAELARRTKRSQGAVTQWLDGTTKTLKADTAEKIEAATGYNSRWIVTGRGEQKVSKLSAEVSGDTSHSNSSTPAHSPEATSIAVLYDMLPMDPVIRARAYNLVTEPLIRLLRPDAATTLAPAPAETAKTQP